MQTLTGIQDWDKVDGIGEELMLAFPDSGAIKGLRAQAMLWGRGDLDETLEFWTLMPLHQQNQTWSMKHDILIMQEDWEGAIEWVQSPEQRATRMPMFNPTLFQIGQIHLWSGNQEEARWHFEQYLDSVRDHPRDLTNEEAFRLAFMGLAYAHLGDSASAIASARAAEETLSTDDDELFGMFIWQMGAITRALAGDMDEALTRFKAEYGTPIGFVPWQMRLHPRYAFLRDNPRFMALISDEEWP